MFGAFCVDLSVDLLFPGSPPVMRAPPYKYWMHLAVVSPPSPFRRRLRRRLPRCLHWWILIRVLARTPTSTASVSAPLVPLQRGKEQLPPLSTPPLISRGPLTVSVDVVSQPTSAHRLHTRDVDAASAPQPHLRLRRYPPPWGSPPHRSKPSSTQGLRFVGKNRNPAHSGNAEIRTSKLCSRLPGHRAPIQELRCSGLPTYRPD